MGLDIFLQFISKIELNLLFLFQTKRNIYYFYAKIGNSRKNGLILTDIAFITNPQYKQPCFCILGLKNTMYAGSAWDFFKGRNKYQMNPVIFLFSTAFLA